MRKAWKKAVSVLLTLVLIFGVLPAMNVSAEGEGGQGSRSIELNSAPSTVNATSVPSTPYVTMLPWIHPDFPL